MANTTVYICSECNAEHKKWVGKCRECGAFGTLEEREVIDSSAPKAGLKTSGAQRPIKSASTLSQISAKPIARFATGIGELDRVLGGGIVDAEVILLAASPGAGKSTLCMSISQKYAQAGKTVLYSSGEESEQQIAMRAKRMGVTEETIHITNETSLERILGHIDELKPDLFILDSLQTVASEGVTGSVGSISQSKEAAHALTQLAKSQGIAMILISQIVKG